MKSKKAKEQSPVTVKNPTPVLPIGFQEANRLFLEKMLKSDNEGSNHNNDVRAFMECVNCLVIERTFGIPEICHIAKARGMDLSVTVQMFNVWADFLTKKLGVLTEIPSIYDHKLWIYSYAGYSQKLS